MIQLKLQLQKINSFRSLNKESYFFIYNLLFNKKKEPNNYKTRIISSNLNL